MMNANNEIKPSWKTAQRNKQILTAHYIGEKPYIKLTVNKQHELLFLVDTGASFTMLFDTPAVSKLQFKKATHWPWRVGAKERIRPHIKPNFLNSR